MCISDDSGLPIFDRPHHSATGSSFNLTSHDGTQFSVFHALPESPTGVGVVVLPDMRGLAPFYEQLTLSLANQEHAAVAIDYYGRTAGTTPRTEQFPFMQHIMQVTAKTIGEDIMSAIQYLRTPAGGNCRKVLALGFCFGGRQAFLASAPRFSLAGVIGFYGALSFYPNGAPGPLQRVSELSAPILGIFGGADAGIPMSDVAAFDEALTVAGVEHEIVTYPDAPHGFFDIKFKGHASACADAWRRVLAFITAHSN
jgi:carboxymethylenebutenolidase